MRVDEFEKLIKKELSCKSENCLTQFSLETKKSSKAQKRPENRNTVEKEKNAE